MFQKTATNPSSGQHESTATTAGLRRHISPQPNPRATWLSDPLENHLLQVGEAEKEEEDPDIKVVDECSRREEEEPESARAPPHYRKPLQIDPVQLVTEQQQREGFPVGPPTLAHTEVYFRELCKTAGPAEEDLQGRFELNESKELEDSADLQLYAQEEILPEPGRGEARKGRTALRMANAMLSKSPAGGMRNLKTAGPFKDLRKANLHGHGARRSRQIFYSTNSKGSVGEYTQRSRSSTSRSAFLK